MMNTRVAAGVNDYPHFADGWHDRTADGRCGIEFRPAAGERGVIKLARQTGARELVVLYSGPRGMAPGALCGALVVNGASHPLRLDADLWRILRVPLPAQTSDELLLEFLLDDPPIPDTVLHNGDSRPMGWFVSAVWQEGEEEGGRMKWEG